MSASIRPGRTFVDLGLREGPRPARRRASARSGRVVGVEISAKLADDRPPQRRSATSPPRPCWRSVEILEADVTTVDLPDDDDLLLHLYHPFETSITERRAAAPRGVAGALGATPT